METKMRFGLSNWNKFKFNPVIKKKSSIIRNTTLSKKVYITCAQEEDGEFTAHIDFPNDSGYNDVLVLPFTKRSYKLEGKLKIFTKVPDKYNKYTCIIRSESQAKRWVNDEIYTPFRNDYIYSGHIVLIDGKKHFDVDECFGHSRTFGYLLENNDKSKFKKESENENEK